MFKPKPPKKTSPKKQIKKLPKQTRIVQSPEKHGSR